MAFIIGLLLIVLGAVALWAWFPAVLVFLKGLVVFSLLFWGLVSLIAGYASWKGKRQTKSALNDGPPLETEDTPAGAVS